MVFDFRILQQYLGAPIVNFISVAIFGFVVAVTYPKFIVTPQALANDKAEIMASQKSEDSRIEKKLDISICNYNITNARLEESLLRKEQNDLMDMVDKGAAKERHRIRLNEITNRLLQLKDIIAINETELQQYAVVK